MDVGTIHDDGTFDIADVDEQEQLLLKTDEGGVVRTRWVFKNPEGKIVIHERSENHPEVAKKGSYLEIGLPGYAVASMNSVHDSTKIAKLMADINWADVDTGTSPFYSKTVEIDGESYVAVLAPVKLL